MSKPKSKIEVSPKGVFVYPCLTRPDTKFNAGGVYSVKLRLSADAAAPLVDMIDKAIDAQVEKVKASGEVKGRVKRADAPYSVDGEAGEVTVNFKMLATGKRQDGTAFTQKPGLKKAVRKDGKAVLVDLGDDVRIGGGTEGKVAYVIAPFYTSLIGAGVTLRLKAVQVIKLVEPQQTYGFDAEDGCEEEIEDGDSADAPSGSEGGDSGSEDGAGDGDF